MKHTKHSSRLARPLIARIRQVIADSGLSQNAFARLHGISEPQLSQILTRTLPVTRGMASRLSLATGIPPEDWPQLRLVMDARQQHPQLTQPKPKRLTRTVHAADGGRELVEVSRR